MALKKSELYSSLWQSCDALRGGMDASQYKDYVLVLLFLKYVSDKYAGKRYAPITIPPGSSFQDMVALKGKSDIGEKINTKVIAPLAKANQLSQSDFPDFNDSVKLGNGKEMVDRLTDLISIFENPALDFSRNRADGDDILGDAYEYLMRHFATESGKSKGQFYTPAEVSRVIAQILGIRKAKTSASTTVYDPTCGSGSLLLKVADEAGSPVTIYGQEKDATTSVLARMNMILHNHPTALIMPGNSLTDPQFKGGSALKTFDYVVANPPFSDKRWSTGLDPLNDPFERFTSFGAPPAKQGDYAYLLHIVRSLKSTGKGACILPHGVLFRGNAEATIRRALVRKGYIKGIIGLPANLFYGTGIPACIVVIDKENAQARKGIFMIDASGGFMKDGSKNRLRSMDIHKIVDVFNKGLEVPRYARMVPIAEIEKNDFNLNLPRYIDSQTPEDLQDIEGHLRGGIPATDIDALERYWAVCPQLRHTLFKKHRRGYLKLSVERAAINSTIYEHPEFAIFIDGMNAHFTAWRKKRAAKLKVLEAGCHPKEIIAELSESLLAHYAGQPLIDAYDVYQHLMDYWAETMQDDCYLISADGWKAETRRIIEKDKKGKEKDKGWTCELIPKAFIVARYFAKEQDTIDQLAADLEGVTTRLTEMEEEHSSEDGAFSDLDKVNKANVATRLREIQGDRDAKDEAAVLNAWLKLNGEEADLKRRFKEAEVLLDTKSCAKYPKLTESEIKALVVDEKWLAALYAAIHGEMDRVSQQLTQRERTCWALRDPAAATYRPRGRDGGRGEPPLGKDGVPMEVKRGYKQTEVGVIPKDWSVVAFAQAVGAYIDYRGRTPRKLGLTWGGGNILALSANNVQMGRIDASQEAYAGSEELYRKWMTQGECAFGDVLLTMEAPLGNVAQIPDSQKYILSQRVILIKPKDWLLRDYLAHYMKGALFQSQLALNATGTTAQGIQRRKLDQLSLYLPPTKVEQEAIAEVLSDADALNESLEQLVTKKRQIKQGAMQNLLTGKRRLPGFGVKRGYKRTEAGVLPEDWEVTPLSNLLEFRNGVNAGKKAYGTGIPFINVLEVITKSHLKVSDLPGRISLPRRTCDLYSVRRGDLVFNRTSETQNEIGLASVFLDDEPVVFGGFVIRARPISGAALHSEYAGYALRSPSIRRQMAARGQGAIRANIGQTDLRSVLFPLPSLLEQRSMATMLADIDDEIIALEAKLAKARQIKQGLMQELLTGRIRLV